MNVRNLTLEYFSGKFIPNDNALSEQFPKSNIKMEKETKSIPLTYKINIYYNNVFINETGTI
jgi:hypothetical protein